MSKYKGTGKMLLRPQMEWTDATGGDRFPFFINAKILNYF